MKRIRYAVIGFGRIAQNRIVKEGFACDTSRFSPLKNAVLTGIYNRSQDKKEAVLGMGLKWYSSLEELWLDKDIDAVFIATNNATHVPITLQAFAAGKHVITEKPMATTLADAETAVKTAADKKLSYTVDHMMIHNAWNRKAAAMVQSGKLGTVNDCCFHMECLSSNPKAWRCTDAAEMGGPIGDMASHCFYMAEFIYGKKISRVAASYLPRTLETEVENGAIIIFYFEDGTRGTVRVSIAEERGGPQATVSNLGFEIYGDKAVLRSYGSMFQLSGHDDEPVAIRLELDRFDGKPRLISPGKTKNIYQAVIEKHASSIIKKQPLNADDGVHNLLLCKAAYFSAENNGKITDINTFKGL